ncbi:hypothetical protein GCM10010431_39010 [Streptomyces kunmingensis]
MPAVPSPDARPAALDPLIRRHRTALRYVALLAGPPALGFVGEHHGLRGAMIPVLLLMLLAAVLSPATAAGPRRSAAVTGGRPSVQRLRQRQRQGEDR